MSRTVLASIHPEHVTNILSGKKVFEYRKAPLRQIITNLAIYCTSPVKKIVAVAEVLGVVDGSPTKVWKCTSFGSGISRRHFRNYFSGQRRAYAFVLGKVYALSSPLELSDLTRLQTPPQSICYLNNDDSELIFQRVSKNLAVPPSLYFVGGVHGVGKSTICQKVFAPAGYQCVTASSLIASRGRQTDKDKHVRDIDNNQNMLLQQLELIKEKYCRLLLDGHFTLINSHEEIEPIALEIFEKIKPTELILIKGCPDEISNRLKERDGKNWDAAFLKKFQVQEEEHSRYISEKTGVPLRIINNNVGISKIARSILEYKPQQRRLG